ncbi:ribokinase [Trichonephila inaurata madagascariensis]|uniref:Ribokinase n=1 Tax=Trichonephila inaurata madagascariensis TaxID=2747483 RepID=A0A8X6WXJ2_9ARAC|nr:ribokinase [Trichonephila inaurata madagascariensis]
MPNKSIVVVGGCIVDLISYIDRFPKPGETLTGLNFVKGCGGKAANQCVMAKKLGASTAMIAKLGDDSFGHEYMDNLKELKIDTEFVTFSKTSHTSTASIAVSSDGQNSIIYVPGAIMELASADVTDAENLIKNAKVLLCSYECPLPTLVTAFETAKKYGVRTVLNAAPSTNPSYEKLYPLVDIICLNEIEAEDATGLSLKDIPDCVEIFKILHEKGCSTVILTMGSKGVVFKNKDQEQFDYVPARTVTAVDCTGAGDAFMGSLVFFLSEYPNMSLPTVIEKSCAIATLSVMKKGTQSSFPNREDIPKEFFYHNK